MEQPDKSLDDFAMWRFCDLHIAGDDCPYCRITELETQNKILSDSIMAGTNVYKRQLKNAETESSNRGRALKEIIRLASEYTTGG